ncbi:putative phytosulfokines 6 [Neltuma alba]|uniref:putative phytosulfokines 6 n=1 Tax=Neltuma alba TaxID=207710 RepID=UPI0010A2F804|nr:putative phytosulfokines 6 [Prosopis alba]
MKKTGLRVFFCFLLSLLLLFHFSASARLIRPSRDEKEGKAIDVTNAGSTTELKFDIELAESDQCDEEDEECSERRRIAEAHLDYIYTQHHKPAYKHKP